MRGLDLTLMLGAVALAGPSRVPVEQAQADFVQYVSQTAQVRDLRGYHGSNMGAGDPIVLTFRAAASFRPQAKRTDPFKPASPEDLLRCKTGKPINSVRAE